MMVLCVVISCSSRSGRDKGVSFFRIPTVVTTRGSVERELTQKRRDGYLASISRGDLTEKIMKNDRICSKHFVLGKPAYLYDTTSTDWLPTLNLGHSKSSSKRGSTAEARYERAKRRKTIATEASQSLPECSGQEVNEDEQEVDEDEQEDEQVQLDVAVQATCSTLDTGIQTVLKCEDMVRCESVVLQLKSPQMFTEDYFSSKDDAFIKFYTGLPNFYVLKVVFDFVAPPISRIHKLNSFQEFLVVMMKLRLNCFCEDLAYRFEVSPSTISRILHRWIPHMDGRLSKLIVWPDRDSLQKTMPLCFQESFGNKVAVIIDCFEIFIERPSNLQARTATWSSYKHHNTAKVLLCCTPQGVISYVSVTWGGRVSDKYLTEHCGMLNNLIPGDVVLADRGFDISDSVGAMQASLSIPAFTKGKSQLSALEIEETRTIANVRIHIERVIGNVRQKYTILKGTLPIDYVTARDGCAPIIDSVVRISCALTNLCNSVVPFE